MNRCDWRSQIPNRNVFCLWSRQSSRRRPIHWGIIDWRDFWGCNFEAQVSAVSKSQRFRDATWSPFPCFLGFPCFFAIAVFLTFWGRFCFLFQGFWGLLCPRSKDNRKRKQPRKSKKEGKGDHGKAPHHEDPAVTQGDQESWKLGGTATNQNMMALPCGLACSNRLEYFYIFRGQKNRPRKKNKFLGTEVPRNFSDQCSLDFAYFLCLFLF